MDLSRPHSALSTSRDLDVLKVLAGTTRPMSGRQLARVAEVPASTARVVLDRLVEQGIVRKETAGQASTFTLNRDHLAAPAAELLATMWPDFLSRVREALQRWRPAPVHASLFGSAARRDGGVASDIDILLVRPERVSDEAPKWRRQVEALEDSIGAWTGNRAAIVEVSEGDLPSGLRDTSPFVTELREDAIDLAGVPVRKLFDRA